MADPYACTIVTYADRVCVECPEVPAIAAVPTQTLVDRRLGWNAGARSALEQSGDCYARFTVPAHVVGVVCGLGPAQAVDPRDVPHGFYVYQDSGRELWRVVEAGVGMTAPVVRAPGTDVFRIERRGGTVRYFLGDSQVYRSSTPAAGACCVVACLYADNDGID